MPGMLSERIAALRKERGLTQEQLGKMVGVSYQAVGKSGVAIRFVQRRRCGNRRKSVIYCLHQKYFLEVCTMDKELPAEPLMDTETDEIPSYQFTNPDPYWRSL